MQNRKLLSIVTMMIMVGTTGSAQQRVTIDELRTIERLITESDCGDLYFYLVSNPHTLSGADSLAAELRSFVADVERGDLDCFAAPAQQAEADRNDSDRATRIY